MAPWELLRRIIRHPMRAYYLPMTAGVILGSSAFMPWIAVGTVRLGGVPDIAGLWILGLAILAMVLAGVSIATRKNSRHPLLLVGLFAFGILFLAERLMERTATQQGWAAAQARAIVNGVAVPKTFEPVMAIGAYLGIAASVVITLFGLTVVVKRAPQIYALSEDDDV